MNESPSQSKHVSVRFSLDVIHELNLVSIERGIDISELIRRYVNDGIKSNRLLETEYAQTISILNSKKGEYELFNSKWQVQTDEINRLKKRYEAEIQTIQTSVDLLANKINILKQSDQQAEEIVNSLKEKLLPIKADASFNMREFTRKCNLETIGKLNLQDEIKKKVIEKISKLTDANYLKL